jgi:hypothetical protein
MSRKRFSHLGVSFVSVQDQVDTDSPMGWAMFTIIGAMAELEFSLTSERVTAGMNAAWVRGKRIGRPPLAPPVVTGMEALVATIDLSIRQIQREVGGRASRGVVGEITKRVRAGQPNALSLLQNYRRVCRNFLPGLQLWIGIW